VRVDDPWRQGIELTAAGRVLLDHARVVLLQAEAAMEATRRAAPPAKSSFVLGFLTGYEFTWLAAHQTRSTAQHRSSHPQPVLTRPRRWTDARQD
jgi:DNA-binding transcriptional LysR family regulator